MRRTLCALMILSLMGFTCTVCVFGRRGKITKKKRGKNKDYKPGEELPTLLPQIQLKPIDLRNWLRVKRKTTSGNYAKSTPPCLTPPPRTRYNMDGRTFTSYGITNTSNVQSRGTPTPFCNYKCNPHPTSVKSSPAHKTSSKIEFTTRPNPSSEVKSTPFSTTASSVKSTPNYTPSSISPTPFSKVKSATSPIIDVRPTGSATTEQVKSTPTGKMKTTKKPETTAKLKKNNEALENLAKNKVSKDNVKEVAEKLMKVFEKSRPIDMTKDDVGNAADVLEDIVSITEKLNETSGNMVEFIDSFMEMNKTTLADSRAASSKIIKVLDKIVEFIPFDDNATSFNINKTNIIIQANLVNPQTFDGITFGTNSGSTGKKTRMRQEHNIKLPRDVVKDTNTSSVRIGFIYYAYNKLFQANNSKGEPSEVVLSGSVFGQNVTNLNESVVIQLPLRRPGNINTTQCVFWVDSALEWSSAGCSFCPQQSSKESVQCCCNHLTSFAVLFSPEKRTSPRDDGVHSKILSIISYLGCIISLTGVIITFMTYSMFRHLRKTNQQPILMNLCIAIALLLIVFVAGINSTNNTLGCQIVAVLLHYLTLVTVLWMGIEAYNLYLQIVKVMAIYQRRFMLKAAIVGWGVPLLIVVPTLVAAIFQYKHSNENMIFYYGNDQLCILHNQHFKLIAWFSPILGILLMNLIAFISIVYKLNNRHSVVPAEPKSQLIKSCLTALAIMCLLGLTWLFGALAISDARIVFEYLFCIFNSLQGCFIFFFHCVRIKEVRSQWSLFISGLGSSHGDMQNSQDKSRDMQKLRKDSESVRMHNMSYRHAYHTEEPIKTLASDGCQTNIESKDGRSFSNCSHYSTGF